MRGFWNSFKRFLTAEEVPRWFGLSIVLIYLVGLATVANVGIGKAKRDATEAFRVSSRYALTALADRLASVDKGHASESEQLHRYQHMLREFAVSIPVRSLWMVEDEVIIASTRLAEIGTKPNAQSTHQPTGLTDGSPKRPGWSLRVDIESETSTASTTAALRAGEEEHVARAPAYADGRQTLTHEKTRYVEGRFPSSLRMTTDLFDHAGALAIVLVVLGALFVVYRCLREQLRGVHRIAGRLQTHRDRIAEDLASLHIMDALDGTTIAWNELVDLTQQMVETAQRTEANEELSRALQQTGGGALSEALNALPDGLMFISDETHIEYVNSCARRLFGWNAEEPYPSTIDSATVDGVCAEVFSLVQEARQSDGMFSARSLAIDPDGKHTDDQSSYHVWVIPLQRPHHQGECLVVIRDVSQQLRAERAREEFVSQVTHELRTPLTNIRAYAETLTSGMFDDPKVITECYNVITKETRRLSRLIEDILSVSQLEVGSIDLVLDQTDLKALLSDGIRDVRGIADEKNIDIQLVLPPKMEPIQGDRDKLAIVINNLLGNAVKYTQKGGNIVVGCQFSGSEAILTFKDNGIGIEPSEHARVFEKFQRGNDPDVRNETGTGIGLYTAREIVRRHNGEIELISEKGQGSTFLVRLPRQQNRAGDISTGSEV